MGPDQFVNESSRLTQGKLWRQKKRQLDRGALRGDSSNAIHNREADSALCRKELRPDLFNKDDPCTVMASDKFNMEHKCKLLEETVVGAEQKVTKFFQTPVEIDEARTMSRALLNHRVQELRNLHGQEWILATDGSFGSKTNDQAGWGLFVLSPSGICWLFSGATETERNMEGWHGEEDHTNNTGEMKAMLAAHVFIQHLQEIAGWQEARHEAPVQQLRDVQKVTIAGHEWLNPLPNPRRQEPYDFIHRALIEQLTNSGQRTISIAEMNMKKCIVYDSEIAGFAAMGTRQVTNHVKLASVLQTMRRQIRRKEESTCSGLQVIRNILATKWRWVGVPWLQGHKLLPRLDENGFQEDSQLIPRSRNRSSHCCSTMDGQDFEIS